MLTSISRKKSHYLFLLAATLFPQYNLLAKCKETNVKNIYMSVNSDKYLRIAYGIDKTNAEKELILYKDLYQVASNKNEQPKLLQKNIEINALAEKVCLKEGETTASTATPGAAAATTISGSSVGPSVNEALAQAKKNKSGDWEDDEVNGVSKRRTIGEHGETVVETRTMDGRIVKDYYDPDTGRQLRATEVVTQGSAKQVTVPSDTGGAPAVAAAPTKTEAIIDDRNEMDKQSDLASKEIEKVNSEYSAGKQEKLSTESPPSKEEVTKADMSLQNVATALSGANDIIAGMKQGDLKGYAQAANGALDIAMMMTAVDVEKMTAAATKFEANIKSDTKLILSRMNSASIIPFETQGAATNLDASTTAYLTAVKKCAQQLSTSQGICDEKKNGNAIAVTKLMTAGAGLIQNLSSASETCGTTADLTKIAGLGVSGVGLMCSANQKICQSDCGSAATALGVVEKDLGLMLKAIATDTEESAVVEGNKAAAACTVGAAGCYSARYGQVSGVGKGILAEAQKLEPIAKAQNGATIQPTTMACVALGANILKFAMQAADLVNSSKDADKCKKALTAGNGGGGGSAITNVTTEEMCKNSANASLQVCKCHKDATAQGCPGAIAKALSKDPGGLTIKGGSGVSQLAGFGSKSGGTAGTNNFGGGSGGESSGLSEAAKQALGLNTGNPNATAANSVAGGSETNGTSGSGSDSANKNQAENFKAKKFDFGSFGSISSGISNFFGGKGKKSGSTAAITDKQIEKAKRQIASAQLRNEVSTASGKSNWDKIRARYVENRGSFMGD